MVKKNKNIYMNKLYRNSKGALHRLDGPAIERSNGTKFWYKEDLRHRIDGPAVEYSNGDKYWYKEGKEHRVDGPSCEYINGDKHWFILDKDLKEKEFNSWIFRIQKCM